MKSLVPLFLSAVLTAAACAADATFYLGTYTRSGKSEGIYVGKLDTETGKLGPLTLAGKANNPSFVALSPTGRFLYAAMESDGGAVGAFAVRADGTVRERNQASTGGAGACHVWVDATGRTVFAANYGGGSVAALPVRADGGLGERSAFVQFTGHGSNKERQDKPHAHAIYLDAANLFAYAPDLGTDNVWIFHFDAANGTLTPAQPESAKVPDGAGPRHLAFHPNGQFVYVNNEMGLSVTVFSRDAATGALTPVQTVLTVPVHTPRAGVSTAEIFCHPTGKWLYVSNRGHDTIAVFAIADDGKLTRVQNAPAAVKVPRGFGIDPSGRWIIAAGQDDDRIAVHRIDLETGKLTATGETAEVGSPVCVLFAPAK